MNPKEIIRGIGDPNLGIYGGGPIWFLLGVVYVCLVVENKMKYVLLISGYSLFAACYYVAYAYPEMIIQHTTQMAYIDSIMTLMVVSGLTCAMILFQNAIFRSENALAQKLITYAGLTTEELNEIKEQVMEKVPFEHIICQKASPAVATNCRPGTFGLLFMTKD